LFAIKGTGKGTSNFQKKHRKEGNCKRRWRPLLLT
jgi:hypothetical protein